MKLAQELKALDTITEKLNIYLAGLRAEGPLVGALEYAQSEAEAAEDDAGDMEMLERKVTHAATASRSIFSRCCR